MEVHFNVDVYNQRKWKDKLSSYFIRSSIIARICMCHTPPNLKTALSYGNNVCFLLKRCRGMDFMGFFLSVTLNLRFISTERTG